MTTPDTPKRRGRPPLYTTEAERRAAKVRRDREYRARQAAKIAKLRRMMEAAGLKE